MDMPAYEGCPRPCVRPVGTQGCWGFPQGLIGGPPTNLPQFLAPHSPFLHTFSVSLKGSEPSFPISGCSQPSHVFMLHLCSILLFAPPAMLVLS